MRVCPFVPDTPTHPTHQLPPYVRSDSTPPLGLKLWWLYGFIRKCAERSRRRLVGTALAAGQRAVALEVRPGFAFVQLLGAPRGALEVPAGRRRGRPRRWRRVGDALVAGQRAVALEPRLVALVGLLLAKRARLDVLARRQREWRRGGGPGVAAAAHWPQLIAQLVCIHGRWQL